LTHFLNPSYKGLDAWETGQYRKVVLKPALKTLKNKSGKTENTRVTLKGHKKGKRTRKEIKGKP
jgi:hypothetical protein